MKMRQFYGVPEVKTHQVFEGGNILLNDDLLFSASIAELIDQNFIRLEFSFPSQQIQYSE
ncbi:MAG: hypothetical protein H6546_06945 [Chitinophagales bacterium]|nr:hypothetical protein [Chitinophagales bacterium]